VYAARSWVGCVDRSRSSVSTGQPYHDMCGALQPMCGVSPCLDEVGKMSGVVCSGLCGLEAAEYV
jgi:hypothetical protein